MESDICIISEYQPPELEQHQPVSPPGMAMGVDERVLPDDLLVEILSRLTVRDLLRLRCVRKSWCALIDNFDFIKKHYEFQYSVCKEDGDIPLIYWEPQLAGEYIQKSDFDINVYLLSKPNGHVPLNMTADLVRDSAPSFANAPDSFKDANLVGAVNGIVCYVWGRHDLGLWNPATREFKPIKPWLKHPIQDYHLHLIGFGFDSVSNDFKIVRGYFSDNGRRSDEVYSLNSDTWKPVKLPLPLTKHRDYFSSAYLNGVCYWYVHTMPSRRTSLILSFNFATDVFEVFNEPHYAIGSEIDDCDVMITLYKECLAFVLTHANLEKAVRNFDVWVVTESHVNSGTPVAWQHLVTLGPFPSSDVLSFTSFRMDGDILFIIRSSMIEESSLYNISTGTFNNLGILVVDHCRYVASLFPLSNKLNLELMTQ